MKQRIKKIFFRRNGCAWALLALPLLWGNPLKTRAQEAPRPDSTSQMVAPLPALLGDTVRVHLELQSDSLVAEPAAPAAIDSARLEWLRTPPTVRDLVCDRVGCFDTDVPHTFNNSVMSYITLFTSRNRAYMQRVLERENFYFPIFEKYLAQYNLPTDLKYLAVVESALIPTAKSPVGATGLWQFMGPTAGDLRLKRDEWVDERMHPEKATEAACKHLRYLYGMFHDWELVLAAYNWGAGSVQRVMRRTGKKNFWDLYPYMPTETRNYVPTFTAIMYSMKYAHAHGLHSDKLSYQYAEAMDTLGLHGQPFDLRRLSRACGYADSLYLVRFNPEMRRAALPVGYRPYVVRYPASVRPHLGDVDRATLLDYCQPAAALPQALAPLLVRLAGVEPFPSRPLLAATEGPRTEVGGEGPRFRRVRHTVRRGETLAAVAENFGVSQSQLRRWNELPKGRALKPGSKLLVFLPLAAPTEATAGTGNLAIAPAVAPEPARTTVADEQAAARKALAAANAREVARLAALAEQEKQQEARLARLRLRQEAALRAVAKAEAAAKAALAATRAEEAAAHAAARQQAIANTNNEEDTAKTPAAKPPVSKRALVSNPPQPTKAAPETSAAKARPTPPPAERIPATYTVRKGDHLTRIANEYGLSIAQLSAWNELESETVMAGQKLRLHAPAASETDHEPTRKQAHPVAKAAVAGNNNAPAGRAVPPALQAAPKIHLVQPGDTLYNISRRFGVSVEALRQLNNLTSDEVKLGQKLLLPQG